jgi:hypothetical protein
LHLEQFVIPPVEHVVLCIKVSLHSGINRTHRGLDGCFRSSGLDTRNGWRFRRSGCCHRLRLWRGTRCSLCFLPRGYRWCRLWDGCNLWDLWSWPGRCRGPHLQVIDRSPERPECALISCLRCSQHLIEVIGILPKKLSQACIDHLCSRTVGHLARCARRPGHRLGCLQLLGDLDGLIATPKHLLQALEGRDANAA